jgi:hypothetical protein
MPRTVQCPTCGVVLNVPDAALGRRLKCPKCATKFAADGSSTPDRPPSSSPGFGSSNYGRPSSSTLSASGHGDFDLPTAPGSLRETFDLPMRGEAGPASRSPMAAAPVADPMALFRDDPPSRRKATAAEGRSRARRCPTCGGVVPQGMSLCPTCGLDLETGTRIDLTEQLETVPGPYRPSGPPIGVWIVGGLSISVSLIFSIISLLQTQKGETGYFFLLVVCFFGIFAAVQFLRSKSVKLLFVALTLGVMIDVVAMILVPVITASSDVAVHKLEVPANGPGDETGIAIANIEDKLDTSRLSWGIAILISYGAVVLYLNSPAIRRYYR